MPFALFAMLLMPFGLEYYPLVVMGQGLDWMLTVARYVASLDGEWTTGRMGDVQFFLIAFGGILLCVLRTRLALVGAGLIALGVCAIALEPQKERPSIAISEDAQLVGLITRMQSRPIGAVRRSSSSRNGSARLRSPHIRHRSTLQRNRTPPPGQQLS